MPRIHRGTVPDFRAAIDPEQERLIECLDPHRDYGDLGYEGVIAGVRAGWVRLKENTGAISPQPLIYNAIEGGAMKGTAKLHRSGGYLGRNIEQHRARFHERANEDFDAVYNALYESCVKDRDPRSIKIYLEHYLGAPVKALDGGGVKDLTELMKVLQAPATQRIEYIDAETGEARP